MSNQKIPPDDTDNSSEAESPADQASQAKHSAQQTDRVSVRAHFKSQHREESVDGSPDKDWLEAEREIDSATKGDQL